MQVPAVHATPGQQVGAEHLQSARPARGRSAAALLLRQRDYLETAGTLLLSQLPRAKVHAQILRRVLFTCSYAGCGRHCNAETEYVVQEGMKSFYCALKVTIFL